MSEFDCDEGWDVSKEAESLNKSLFGLKSKKKRKQKARKDENESFKNVLSSNLLEDSDDETFTKKGIRKLKERRRKQKKRSDKSGEINSKEESPALSSNVEHKLEGKKDSSLLLNKSVASLQKNQKHLKIEDKKSLKLESEVKGAEQKKASKRKRATSAKEADDLSITQKKKKIEVDNVAAVSNGQSELEATGKKTKRKRKKRNNSKKNKYAHLALNRKENGTRMSENNEKSDAVSSACNAESSRQGRKLQTEETQLFERKKVIQPPKDLSEKDKSGKKRTSDMHHSPTKSVKNAKLRTVTADSSVLDYTDMKNISKVGLNNKHKLTSATENEIAVAVDFDYSKTTHSSKKNQKRKKDSSAATDIKLLKAEKTLGKQDLTNMDSSKNKLKPKTKAVEENVQLKKGKESTTVKNSNALEAPTKISESVDPSKMLELQQKQKKLLYLLNVHGNGEETTTVQKKKRNKKKKLEITCTTIQSQEPNSPTKNVKKNLENVSRTKLEESANTSKIPAVSKQQQDNSNSTSKSSSIWGAKASAIGSQAQEKLNAARFRYLNEQLYTCQGSDALQLFKEDREAFNVYHTGFENQASKWPVNPVNVIIKQIKDKSSSLVIADFGCGDAKLAQALPQKVHSFDLVALNPWVKACDMSSVPLQNESIDISVFCLSLMGTNLDDYIHEANRVLKTGGLLKIVEVVSRFRGLSSFLAAVCSHGFQLLNKRDLSQMFYLMDFKKVKTVKKAATVKGLSLKPCVYKKR